MRTPLYYEHKKLGARMVAFGAWEMPVAFRGILEEHQHTRRVCSIFDICHMGKFEFRGETAASDLARLLSAPVATLLPGRGAYGYLLNEQARPLDDVIVFCRAPAHYWLVVNSSRKQPDAAWIQPRLSPSTMFADVDGLFGKLDIQGPKTRECLEKALGARLPDLRYFQIAEAGLLGEDCVISRTGYTGEFGYELYPPLAACERFWQALLAAGEIKPAGLGARDTLRLEMGYPLYGHELSLERSPVGATGERFLAKTGDFIGREAAMRELEQGPAERLAGLRLHGRMAAREGDAVFMAGRIVGKITSGLFGPSLQCAIALAYLETACSAPGGKLQVRAHGKMLDADVVELPFYKNGTCRLPPAAK